MTIPLASLRRQAYHGDRNLEWSQARLLLDFFNVSLGSSMSSIRIGQLVGSLSQEISEYMFQSHTSSSFPDSPLWFS